MCDDGRIIKQAVMINLSPNNEMTITPVSPCFMKSTNSSRWELLKFGITVPINPGDICSLVSDKCWFKVILIPDPMENNQEHAPKRQAKEGVDYDVPNKKSCSESGEGDNLGSPTHVLNKMLNKNNNAVKVKDERININEENLSNDKAAPDVAVQNFKEIHGSSSTDEDKMHTSNFKLICKSQNINQSSSLEQHQDLNRTTTNVVTDVQSPVPMQANELNVSSNVATSASRREKCKYGKKCYRRNAEHKAEFSHPEDFDYDIRDDRKECLYGTRCYRKNPQHKMQYKHTAKNVTNERREQHREQIPTDVHSDTLSDVEDLSAEESVDESEYEPSSDAENSNDDETYFSESEWENEN